MALVEIQLPKFVTITTAARQLGCSRQTLYRRMTKMQPPIVPTRIGDFPYLTESDLKALNAAYPQQHQP